jgi:hypothetical protein
LSGDIIDNDCTNSPFVIGLSDGPESLLTGSIPDLRFEYFAIDVEGSTEKFYSNSGFGLEIKLFSRVPEN